MSAYYNEHDPFAAAWLRALITDGLIADGEVDERDIQTLDPDDLRGFTQCHFFAGIGGWSYALRLAGWPDDRPVWTGSCPCQPFSAAGAQAGGTDPRHLWPAWYQLIRECRPPVVFGEQVEAAVGHGWLDLVSDDLEREDYAVGAVGLPAASVGAPHIRQRLWFVAESERPERRGWDGHQLSGLRTPDGEGQSDSTRQSGVSGELADARGTGSARYREHGGTVAGRDGLQQSVCGEELSAWSAVEWLPCRDGKFRPTQPGLFPLAHGISNRVGTLRGAGNAIVPQVAAAFIDAYLGVTA